jgi:hypothetical protein
MNAPWINLGQENPCRKTGADVWVTSHCGYLHGDVYKVGDVYYLRYVGTVLHDKSADACDYIFDSDRTPYNAVLEVGKTILINQLYVWEHPNAG